MFRVKPQPMACSTLVMAIDTPQPHFIRLTESQLLLPGTAIPTTSLVTFAPPSISFS